jgi:hypothetical protein
MLYGGLEGLIPLTKDEILKRISQKEIFSILFGKIDYKGKYTNPIRNDETAGCFFSWHNGILWFCDFADIKTSRDCFELLKDAYNFNFYEVLQYVDEYFGLGIQNGNPIKPTIEIKQVKKSSKSKTQITYKKRSFDRHHKNYWSKYEITKEQLLADKVYPTVYFRIYSKIKDKWITVRPFAAEVTFTIDQWDGDAIKVCRALHKGDMKWITNCTKNHIGINNSFTDKNLVITKSYKDWRVLKNQNLSVIWLQNEGMFPKKYLLQSICATYENIYVWFDNDNAGIKAGKKLTRLISSFHNSVQQIYLPDKSITDPAECIFKNKKLFKNFIKQLS